jgi:PAS domain-containing protein
VAPSRLGRLLEPHEDELSAYQLALAPPTAGTELEGAMRWRRDGWVVQTRRPLVVADSTRAVTVQLALGTPGSLLLRGAVLLLLDAALLGLLWLFTGYLAGDTLPQLRLRTIRQSFRGNVALTLALFFIVPAVALAIWGFGQLASESRRAADALVSHRLLDVMHASGGLLEAEQDSIAPALRALSDRVDAHFGYYRGGRLAGTSASVLADLGVLPPLMDDQAFRSLALRGRLDVIRDGPARDLAERVGYRLIRPGPPSQLGVLALPQHRAELPGGPREDLAFALLLALAAGFVAAIVAAQRTARSLARPVGSLRRAALALGAGEPSPPVHEDATHPTEFEPVFGAFRRVEADLRAGREALEAARRRTERVLATVSTGVVALDGQGRVLLANGQAAALLQLPLAEGMPFEARLPAAWRALADAVADALRVEAIGEVSLEVAAGERRVAAQLASIGGEYGGIVIALTDVTELSRAERVLAWGEMARQVAHEIKNPLTPMRLGIQHLQRTWRDRRGDYGETLEQTTARILGEIDRLDTVARAFSRFGAPSDASAPLEPVDLAVVAREVGQLYALASEGGGGADRGGDAGLRAGAAGRGQGGAREPARERAQRGCARHRGPHMRRRVLRPGRRIRHSPRILAAGVRAAVLHHDERLGPRALDRTTTGGELGGTHRDHERAGEGHRGERTRRAAALTRSGVPRGRVRACRRRALPDRRCPGPSYSACRLAV